MIIEGMFFLLIAVLGWVHPSTGLIEIVTDQGSHDREFRLTCRQLTSHIAIMQASFTPIIVTDVYDTEMQAKINASRIYKGLHFLEGEFNIRLALNQRCSGKNHCSFILHTDCPESKLWGPGQIFIKFACMPEYSVTKYCNLDIQIPQGGGVQAQGFITSPGYPKFYVGQSECRWKIKAPEHQRIEITLLDISLSVGYGSGGAEGRCEDELSVFDEDLVLITSCEEKENSPVLLSRTNSVEIIILGRSGSLVPKRGVLIYYRALECPTLSAPIDGYLVYRNISAAEYMCCVGYVFPDTLERSRTLHCLQNAWDRNLPSECINLQTSHTPSPVLEKNKTMSDSHLIDVVIPSILIAGLLVGNAAIVFVIYRFKKSKTVDTQDEELNTMVSGTTVA